MSNFIIRTPPKLTIVNLDTAEIHEVQYNPTELNEKVAASFAEVEIPGLGHQPEQFSSTANFEVSFSLRYDAIGFFGGNGVQRVKDARKFIYSLLYPRMLTGAITRAGPPRVQLIMPHFWSFTCKFHTADLKSRFQNVDGDLSAFSIEIMAKEVRDATLYSEEVRRVGTVR